jgi:RNA polymerase sigma-70 factor, ECF subfamily
MTVVSQPQRIEAFGSLVQGKDVAVSDEHFAALVGRQSRFVFRVAYSIVRNAHDAEDVVQETFLKLYRSGAWKSMEDEKAFLSRMSWRLAVDQLRRTRNNQAASSDIADTVQDPEQSLIATDRSAVVWRLIDALPEELRQPLALSTVEELSSVEIGKVMGIPEGTVRTRLMRARQILKQKLSVLVGAPND